ncbi:hypothetical protein D3C81_2077250 [compost metagenome]
MSACLSVTVITNVDTRLNAATAMIRVRMMNIMRFSVCTAANQLRFWRDQSRISTLPLMTCVKSIATCGARCMSAIFRRKPDGAGSLNMVIASLIWIKASVESYSK